jgi:hypothetical protein
VTHGRTVDYEPAGNLADELEQREYTTDDRLEYFNYLVMRALDIYDAKERVRVVMLQDNSEETEGRD